MSGTMVQRMAQWVLSFDVAMVDARAIELIKHSVLDSLGCAILTLDEDCVRGVLDHVRSEGGNGQASVVGGGTTSLALATLANGALVRAIDFNDHLAHNPNTNAKLGGHPSDNLSAILAIAEWRNLKGGDVITALLASYELYGRVYKYLTPELPWDHTTSFGFSVPAVAARLLGLDADKTANAIAISAAQSATLGVVRRGQLSHSKFLASALVAERGVEAAQLAAMGVTGPMTVFEDVRGISNGIFRSDDKLEELVAPIGVHMVEGVTIKAHPGMDTSQAAAEAAVKAAAGRKLRASDIASLELIMNDHAMTKEQTADPLRRAPHSRETADHSIHYMVAVALLDGEMTPRQFADGRWFDPAGVRSHEPDGHHHRSGVDEARARRFPMHRQAQDQERHRDDHGSALCRGACAQQDGPHPGCREVPLLRRAATDAGASRRDYCCGERTGPAGFDAGPDAIAGVRSRCDEHGC